MAYKVVVATIIAGLIFLAGALYGGYRERGMAAVMMPGTYGAYSVQKRFDTQNDEPVYWVIGSPLKNELVTVGGKTVTIPVIAGPPKFYEVSRGRVTNLPADAGVDPAFDYTGTINVR